MHRPARGTLTNVVEVDLRWPCGGLLLLATALRVADPTPIARLRLIVFDAYQQLWPRVYDPDLPVRVVLIDEASLKKFGQWPWPRSVLATLTKRLAENGAAVVGFDFVLAEPDRLLASELLKWLPSGPDAAALGEQIKQLPSGDVAFADAIATVPSAMGFIGVDDGTALPVLHSGFAFAGDNPAIYVPAFRGAVASLPLLQEKSAGSGALNWVPEFDQVVRRLPLLVRIGEQLYPSLAAEAVRIAQGATTYVVKASGASGEEAFGRNSGITSVQIGEYQIPTDANGQIWMRFTKSDPRRTIQASSVFDGKIARSELEGRIVLVGTGAAGLSDMKTTPLDASVAGVELHAQAIEQILLGRPLAPPRFRQGRRAGVPGLRRACSRRRRLSVRCTVERRHRRSDAERRGRQLHGRVQRFGAAVRSGLPDCRADVPLHRDDRLSLLADRDGANARAQHVRPLSDR